MRHLLTLAMLASTVVSQSVLPPFDTTYQAVNLGQPQSVNRYGGTAFVPGNPDVLLIAPYTSGAVLAVPLLRNSQGYITGFGPTSTAATVGGTDGGLAFGPNNVLFGTWYGANRLYQIKPGSSAADRADDLTPLGVGSSVGACTFVPAGVPGAGRLKVASWSSGELYDVPLTPDATGTFAPGPIGAPITLPFDVEGLVYAPPAAAMIGGKLLVAEWGSGTVSAFQVDSIGNPIATTRSTVIGGLSGPGGGAVDPITGDILFVQNGGAIVALRNGAACGTYTMYGTATPGASGTPTLGGAGCARIGQTIALSTHHAPNAIGLLALGYYQITANYLGLTVLQSLDVTVVSVTNGTGNWSLPLAIPLDPTLGNHHVFLQAAYLDASTPSGFVGSAGLDLLIR